MNTMFSALGVLNVDHYAVTTRDIIATLKDFLSIPNSKLLRGPGVNPAQDVHYAFVELNGMGIVEILSPLNDDSPILGHLSNGGGAYHLCYAVKDLDNAIEVAQQEFGAKLIVMPKADGAFDGRRVAFLIHPLHGLFELLEAFPSSISIAMTSNANAVNHSSQKEKLLSIYHNVVGDAGATFDMTNMKNCSDWDSFKHLLLIMEVEKKFEVSIPAEDMSLLDSLEKIDAYLTKK
ncbi:VOC family protein [Vibrio vulnificus]|uniref:VOC family protein n=1 Tax=Vibrio vulnificus TaxID=672 RepID=UPI0002F8C745|nr:VOC family protein [Vibrio vulnificus]MDK2702075.1 VOC family protein [Vibrio vulnificus]SUP56593.1 methylmalonyl-CoA epimerase [Vibrio vulnificus]